jgi:hypothetical protein
MQLRVPTLATQFESWDSIPFSQDSNWVVLCWPIWDSSSKIVSTLENFSVVFSHLEQEEVLPQIALFQFEGVDDVPYIHNPAGKSFALYYKGYKRISLITL